MDATYDAPQIHEDSAKLGHVPIIDNNSMARLHVQLEKLFCFSHRIGFFCIFRG